MAADKPTPLILFSGLAADDNVFAPQKTAFPQLIVPKWPIPLRNETIESYCDRIADDLRAYGPAILGGASFGGIIALHVAKRFEALGVLLIGSVRSPTELSGLVRSCRLLRPLVPLIPVRFFQLCCAPITSQPVRYCFPHLSSLAQQFRGADPSVFKWSLGSLLDWNSIPQVDCPVFHVHGDWDLILPMRYTKPDTIIRCGGHVISLTHAADINDFIRSAIAKIEYVTSSVSKHGLANSVTD